jgi:tetratricopeptide (TPR) repeat protein
MIFNSRVKYAYLLLLALTLLLKSNSANAQAAWQFVFGGRVEHTDEKGKDVGLEGATCTLTKDGATLQTVTTGSKGKFSFKLDPNGDYIVSLTKPGFIVKKFAISTHNVPDERASHGFNPWDIEIVIFEQYPGLDYSITNNPIAKVVYNPTKEVDEFSNDDAYTAQMKGALAKLEELARQAREKDKTYAAALAAGDKAFQNKDFNGAKAQYTAASLIKPGEQGPKDKIIQCDAALAQDALKGKADADYKTAIAAGDAAMGSKSYDAAKAAFQKAAGLKPDEKYPPQKLKEIADVASKAAADQALTDKYNAAIKKGDAALAAKSYDAAKAGYTEAAGVKPAETYPKQKLKELDDLINKDKAAKDLDAKYTAAVKKGDDALAAKDYSTAKSGYTDASGIKPAEAYPKQKLKDIDDLISKDKTAKDLDVKYIAAVKKGDDAFAAKTYDAAKVGYNDAATLKPAETYPKQKLKEIDDLISKDKASKELDAKFVAAIKKGDDAMIAKSYDAAKAGYTEASGLKTSEQYPKDKLKAIADLLAAEAKNKDTKAKFDAAVAKADKAFASKDFQGAKAGYNEAITLKSDEQYPKDKLKEIDALLAKDADAKAKNEKYLTALKKGDDAFKAKKYDDARSGYTDALGIKPDEAYPKAQLKAIDDLASKDVAEKALTEKYNAAVKKGDDALAAKKYSDAQTAYINAGTIKPAETYPKQKLKEIDDLLNKDKAAKELDAKYTLAVKKGDDAFGTKDYVNARSDYTDASQLKPSEQYPKDKLKAIADILGKDAKDKELKAKFDAAVAKADKAMGSKDYSAAKAGYNEAVSYKSDEQYPKDKLKELDELLAKDAAGRALNAKYQVALAKADLAFKAKKYDEARTGYTEALAVKPDEEYPKAQIKAIAELGNKEAAEKALNEKYLAAVKKADDAFKAKTYDNAKSGYNEALALKSGEAYPKSQLKAIDDLLAKDAEGKALNEKYQSALKKADNAFGTKDYNAAKTAYADASTFKPAEQYPKDQLKVIADILGKALKDKESKAKYDAAIAKADKAMGAKDYPGAKAGYNEAIGYQSDEQYPKDKLKELDELMSKDAAGKALNAKYQAAIAKADVAFKAKKYDEAKAGYNEALGVKAEEQYPKSQLKIIDDLLNDLTAKAGIDKKYTDAIAKADVAFKSKSYESAKAGYTEALSYKSAEAYPKAQLKAIEDAIKNDGKLNLLNDKYQAALMKGDGAFETKDYTTAKAAFTEATGLKPTEQYPKDKLKSIESILSNLSKNKANDEKYAAAIKKGDAAFSAKTYPEAKASYTEATSLKPDEKYPKDQLDLIAGFLKGVNEEQAKNARYSAAIAKADLAFKAKKLDEAKSGYTEALSIKPGEEYPQGRLKEIDEMIAAELGKKDLNGRYNAAVSKGDEAMQTKDYIKAKAAYEEALTVKPAEAYPKTKLDLIASILLKDEKDRGLMEKYNRAVQSGDKAMAKQDYTTAKGSFTEANSLKPNEMYPKDKLTEINTILSAKDKKEEKEMKYKEAISKGDGSFGGKDYQTARTFYNSALTYKPADAYATQKLAEIDNKLSAEKYKEQQKKKYTDALAKADKAFTAKDYSSAKSAYLEASGMRPGEAYPRQKIKECDDKLGPVIKPVETVTNDDPKRHNPLVDKYGQGTTELGEHMDGTCKVVTRIVVKGDEAWTYEQKTYAWGGQYWFKDGVNISKTSFDIETAPNK